MVQAGQYVTDGTAVFLVCDIRDGAQVGDIKMSPILRKGYVQANGALLSSAKTNYPRLVDFVQENPSLLAADDSAWADNKALYVYDDTNDTLRVPDATKRFIMGDVSTKSNEAKLARHAHIISSDANNGEPVIYGIPSTVWNPGSVNLIDDPEFSVTTIRQVRSGSGMYTTADMLQKSGHTVYDVNEETTPSNLSLIPQIKY